MVLTIITVLIILSISFGLKTKLKISEEESIFVSLIGIGLYTYILGLLNLMILAIATIPIIAIIALIYAIIQLKHKNVKVKELITMPTIIYCVVVAVLFYLTRKAKLQNYDDFMFWATNLKTMCETNLLWASSKIEAVHQTYPPFAGVIEYVFCKLNGGYNEQIAIFAINVLKMTIVLPILKNSKYNIKTFLKSILIFIITYIAPIYLKYRVSTLLVDSLIGIMFAVTMYMSYTLKEKKDYIPFVMLLIALTLVKTNGMLFSQVAVMQIFFIKVFETIKNKEWNKKQILKKLAIIGILLGIIIVSFATWEIYCVLNGKQVDDVHDKNYVENISLIETYNSIMQNENAEERNIEIVQKFIKNLKILKMSTQNKYFTTIDITIAVNIILIIYLIICKEKLKTLANIISLNIGFVIYLITNLILFLFVFEESQGNALLGFSRYVNTYLLAMILNIVFIISRENSQKNQTGNNRKEKILNITKTTSKIVFLIIICLILKQNVSIGLINPSLTKEIIDSVTIENSEIIKQKVLEDEKIFIIDQTVDTGTKFFMLKYLIAPIQTNLLYEWYPVLEKNGYCYVLEISAQELINKLIEEDYNYVFIVNINESFLNDYGEIFNEDAKYELEQLISYDTIYHEEQKTGILLKIDKDEKIILY